LAYFFGYCNTMTCNNFGNKVFFQPLASLVFLKIPLAAQFE
jgi:hypothetical protein